MPALMLLAMATPQERFILFSEACVCFIVFTLWVFWRAHRRR